MDKDTTATIQPLLDKGNTCRKVLKNVLILYIVYLDDKVLQPIEWLFFQGKPQGRDDMGNVGILQSVAASQSEDAEVPVSIRRVAATHADKRCTDPDIYNRS